VTHDVAVVGSPFLDLTFEGLDGLPAPGEEMLSRELHLSPGGSAMTAIGAARLGLAVALISPVGGDLAGSYIGSVLRTEGVTWEGPAAPRTAVTVVMPWAEDRAMATYNPLLEPDAADVARVEARAFVISLRQLHVVPPGARVYAVTGYPEVVGPGNGPASDLERVRAVIANEFEARQLTGAASAGEAALALSATAPTAVVTCGPQGAVGAEGGRIVRAPGLDVLGRDTTGAGDLFVSAFVWADLHGMALEDRLRWATLYAGLSVRTYTPLAGAVRLAELVAAGRQAGLALAGAEVESDSSTAGGRGARGGRGGRTDEGVVFRSAER